MSLLNKCFKIIEDDEELRKQFPELEVGVEFKVIAVDRDDFVKEQHGITAIQIKNGPYVHINSRDTWFWCFYCTDTMDQLEEIEELSSDQYPNPVLISTFDGMAITDRLEEARSRVGGYEANLMLCAADYIRELEKRLAFADKAF